MALVKYWGKVAFAVNLPLTASVALAINRCNTTVTIRPHRSAEYEHITCDGRRTPAAIFTQNYRPFLQYCRRRLRCPQYFEITIENDYPLAAGLASSSAIYAALTLAIQAACGRHYSDRRLSAIARHGSASAARAVLGGVVCLPARQRYAYCRFGADHWPELRVIVVRCADEQKPLSSRAAMVRSKKTSPLFGTWQRQSTNWYRQALCAIANRDLQHLGEIMQQSYLTMFATMHTARPPIFYWNEQSIAVISSCQRLRAQGIPAWETMDAGPQVKILTTQAHVERVLSGIQNMLAQPLSADRYLVSELGAPPRPLPADATSRRQHADGART